MKILNIDKQEQLHLQKTAHSVEAKRSITRQKRSLRIVDAESIRAHFPECKSILCVGCRDDSEVQTFIDHGFHARGIDVANETELIQCLDAHNMCALNETFDVVYTSHSLEHMHTVATVLTHIRKKIQLGLFGALPMSGKLKPGHPSVFEIMATPRNIDFFVRKDQYPIIWNDFAPLEPFEVIDGGYRFSTEDEVYFILKFQ